MPPTGRTTIDLRRLGPEALAPPDAVARIGLVVLSTDATSEADFARLVQSETVRCHTTRIAFENPTTPESLARTGPRLARAAADILPGSDLEAVYFACTSASAVLGEQGVAAAIRSAKPEVPVITPINAAIAALSTLGTRRISILAPYTESVTARVAATFEEAGFVLDRVTCWGLEDDRDMARVAPSAIVEAAAEACDAASEALFVSCTALRAAEVAAAIEARIDRPAITSNQAAAWACRGLAGLDTPPADAGRLFAHPYVAR